MNKTYNRMERYYNIDGYEVQGWNITQEVLEAWPLCREKLEFIYGHNYDHLGNYEQRTHYALLYQMFGIKLTEQENKIVNEYKQKIREARAAAKEIAETDKKRKGAV